MNITFDINTQEGDKLIVSLFSYPFLSQSIGVTNGMEIVEISITRETGTGVVPVKVFGEIAKKLINIADNDPNVIFYYFCDATDEIPKQRNNRRTRCQDYRNELFKLVFQRYYNLAKDNWFDNEVRMPSEDSNYFAHFLIREQHSDVIELLKKEVMNNFQEIISLK